MIKAVLFDYGNVLFGPLLPRRRVRKLAKELRRNGIQTGILSNVFFLAAWWLSLAGGYRGFEPVILSYKERISKPQPAIYKIAIERLGLKPGEILFVDNLRDNVAAAQEAGMKTVLAKGSDQIVTDIKKIIQTENGLQL